MRRVSLFLTVLLSVSASLPAQPPKQASSAYSERVSHGQAAAKAGNYDEAIQDSQAAIKLDAARWEAYFLWGTALMAQSKYEAAVPVLQLAQGRAPADITPRIADMLKTCSAEASKPTADNGPSLADTMKFIEEKLGAIGSVSFIRHVHNSISNTDMSDTVTVGLSNVRSDVEGCRITFHYSVRSDNKTVQDADLFVPLKDVQEVIVETAEKAYTRQEARSGYPEWVITRVEPPTFAVTSRHSGGEIPFDLPDESLANRIAQAITHAAELCGGMKKEPF